MTDDHAELSAYREQLRALARRYRRRGLWANQQERPLLFALASNVAAMAEDPRLRRHARSTLPLKHRAA